MNPVTRALDSHAPLTHAVLSDLGKGALREYLRSTELPDIFDAEVVTLWGKLISTARSPQVIDKHVTSATNALCVFLNEGILTETPKFKEFVLSKESWWEAFQCAHKAFDDGKTKPAFQILETLCNLLQQMTGEIGNELLLRSALPLLTTVIISSPRSDLKKACLMLSCLVRRTPIRGLLMSLTGRVVEDNSSRWTHCLSSHNVSSGHVSSLGHGSMACLFFALIFTMIDLDTRSSALKLYSNLCSHQSDNPASSDLQTLGGQAIKLFLDRNHAILGYFAENVLPVILSDKTRFLIFIEPYTCSCREDEAKMSVFLAALKVGRSRNILSEDEMLDMLNAAVPDPAPQGGQEDRYNSFRYLLTVASSELRILAYGLLTLSPAANAVVSRGVLASVAFGIKYLHNDADAHERGEILSITRRLLKRISSSHAATLKSTPDKRISEGVSALLADYRSFSLTFYEFIKSELGAQVSYQRHILSLHSLHCFIDHVVDPEIYQYDIMLLKSLTSLVLDPFEDVRSTSASLLKQLGMKTPKPLAGIIDDSFIALVNLLAVDTVRGDHADGLGRVWALYDASHKSPDPVTDAQGSESWSSKLAGLLRQLCHCLSMTTTLGSSSSFPIHGSLLALSYRLQDMRYETALISSVDLSTVLDVCTTIWGMVRSILCVDSPETAYEAEDEDGKEGPKDLLAYSWRALRDSSLLMQSLLMAAEPDSPLYSIIGGICMDQLISLRHRGAFSTVAQTFSMCCDCARRSPKDDISLLIQKWYKVALSQIDEQGDRLTRRSAGLPAMFSALLSPADPSLFSSAILELITLAGTTTNHTQMDEQKLPQVHALNCLKEIMTNSKFSIIVMQFLNIILELAATSLSSPIWAIRNCGLMLLKACINRLDSKSSENSSYSDAEQSESDISDGPSKVALSLLRIADEEKEPTVDSQAKSAETIFSALDLLGHTTQPDAKNSIVDNAIKQHLRHPNWAVRDHAALLLSKRLSIKKLSVSINPLSDELGSAISHNLAHGILLCFRYILKASQNHLNGKELDNALTELAELTRTLDNATLRCLYVDAAILDILNDAAALILNYQWNSERLVTLFSKEVVLTSQSSSVHAPYLQRRRLLFQVHTFLLTSESLLSSSVELSVIRDLVLNPDSLSYVLENLTRKKLWPKAPHGALFLASLTRRLYEEDFVPSDILAIAASCLVDTFDQLSAADLPNLCSIIGMIDLTKSTTREGMNAVVRLEVYRLFPATISMENQKQSSTQLSRWVSMVEVASMDLLDFPTRWSAASALSTYFRLVRQQPDLTEPPQVSLQSKIILYNLLNDDDEDVRMEAASAAAGLLQQHDRGRDELGLSAIAARELLLSRLVQEHGEAVELAESAVMRIILLRENMDEKSGMQSLADVVSVSVSSKLHRLLLAKDDLFAEERQNLYIDDVQEIKIWRGVLCGCVDLFTQEQVDLVAGWALEGLQSVLDTLATSSAKDVPGWGEKQTAQDLQAAGVRRVTMHPFGPTYDADLLVVFVQVLSIAGTIRSRSTGIVQDRLFEQLEEARQFCRGGQVSDVFVTTVNEALAGN